MKTLTVPLLALALLAGCSDTPFIEVDGKAISEAEFQQYLTLKRIPASSERQVERALEDYVSREALAAAIARSDALDHAALDAEVAEFRKQLLISRYFDHHLADIVNESAVANFYAANAERYQARKAKLSHILVRTRPEMSDEERGAALTRINEARSRLGRGEDFAAVASRLSEDSVSAGKGGDLGWMNEGAVSESFSAAAFSLSPGGSVRRRDYAVWLPSDHVGRGAGGGASAAGKCAGRHPLPPASAGPRCREPAAA